MEYSEIFLDTNILVDLVTNRIPFSKNAIKIFDFCQNENIKMYCTSHSIATLHYLAKKMVDEKELRSIIEDLLDSTYKSQRYKQQQWERPNLLSSNH